MRLRPLVVASATLASSIIALSCLIGNATIPTKSVSGLSSPDLSEVFTKNEGQWEERVLFRTTGGGATIWFCRDGIVHQFTHRVPVVPADDMRGALTVDPASIEVVVAKSSFVGANSSADVVGVDLIPNFKCNFFLGSDTSKWRTNVPNYSAVIYRDVYPGIDARFENRAGQLRASWTSKPGIALRRTQFDFSGNVEVRVSDDGMLLIDAPWGQLEQQVLVPHDGAMASDFSPPVPSAASVAAVTPAQVEYSTFLGGSDDDYGEGIAVDGSGNAYVIGSTNSASFPTQDPYDAVYSGYQDVFVTMLSASGSPIYSTFLGGGGADNGKGITVDADGNVYITGSTQSAGFPMRFPYEDTHAGAFDLFVAKLTPDGSQLAYSTFLGGFDIDIGNDIAIDLSGAAYVTGYTQSADFPMSNAYDPSHNGGFRDVFVSKMSPDGSILVYSTFLGGAGSDRAEGIDVDLNGCAYVTGETPSNGFPTRSAYDGSHNGGGADVFVTKLNSSGNDLVYSTFVGGGGGDYGVGIALDQTGSAYITGYTNSPGFPLQNAYDSTQNGDFDAFVTKLSPAGNVLMYSTYLGGSGSEKSRGIEVDADGHAYVTGLTQSLNFPVRTSCDASYNSGGQDLFLARLSTDGGVFDLSTLVGGASLDYGEAVAVDEVGRAYVTGGTSSSDYPTQVPFDASYNGGVDAFVTVFGAMQSRIVAALTIDSLSITPIGGPTYSTQPDSIAPIPFGATVQFHGRALDSSGLTVPGAVLEVFDGVDYRHALSDSGLHCETATTSGEFVYAAQVLPVQLPVGDFYPYWFASDGAALAILVPYSGNCNSLDCLGDSVIQIMTDLGESPDSTIVGLVTDPAVAKVYPNFPPEPSDLGNPANDAFFAGFAQFYSGITSRPFIIGGGSAWLDRGMNKIAESSDSLAVSIRDIISTQGPASGVFYIKEGRHWRKLSAEELKKWWQSKWVSLGLQGAICVGGSIATGGAGIVPFCMGLAIGGLAEVSKQFAVPFICDEVIKARLPEKCREIGNAKIDGVAETSALVWSILSGGVTGGPHAWRWFNQSKHFLPKLKWGLKLVQTVKSGVSTGLMLNRVRGKYYYDEARKENTSALKADSLRVVGVAVDSLFLDDPSVPELLDIPMRVMVTTNDGTGIGLTQTITSDAQKGPETLTLVGLPLRQITRAGSTEPVAPKLSIDGGTSVIVYDWDVVDHDSMKYTVAIPIPSLPDYAPGQIYRATIHLDGYDVFTNPSSSSEATGFGEASADGLDLRTAEGVGMIIPAGALQGNQSLVLTSQTLTECLSCKDQGVADGEFILSVNGLVIAPDTVTFAEPAIIVLKLDPGLTSTYVENGAIITLARRALTGGDWEIIPATLDSSTLLLSGTTTKTGLFAAVIAADVDRDGISDPHDNCVNTFNPDQLDANRNGVGDACDCECDCHSDPECDSVANIFDVVQIVDVAFRNQEPIPDGNPLCPNARTDLNCDGLTNIFDVTLLINVAFRNSDPMAEFCNPCP